MHILHEVEAKLTGSGRGAAVERSGEAEEDIGTQGHGQGTEHTFMATSP